VIEKYELKHIEESLHKTSVIGCTVRRRRIFWSPQRSGTPVPHIAHILQAYSQSETDGVVPLCSFVDVGIERIFRQFILPRIVCGERPGCVKILVDTGYGGKSGFEVQRKGLCIAG